MLILAVTDGRAGNRRQAEALSAALARELDGEWAAHTLSPRQPWKAAAPIWLPYAARGFDPEWLHRLDTDRPAVVVGCGRQAALATRIARHRLGVATRCVQVLDPRLGRNAWDLLVLPEHDDFRDDFTVTCRGSLHDIDAAWLERGRAEAPRLGELPAPRRALLLGGPTEDCAWTASDALAWAEVLRHQRAAQGGSIALVASPRTPVEMQPALRAACADLDLCWLGPDDGPNPYAGVLAWAEALIVSPDSANLLSEACATPARVGVPESPRHRGRMARLHEGLRASGRLSPWVEAAAADWSGQAVPLQETARVARDVADRLRAARGVGQA